MPFNLDRSKSSANNTEYQPRLLCNGRSLLFVLNTEEESFYAGLVATYYLGLFTLISTIVFYWLMSVLYVIVVVGTTGTTSMLEWVLNK